MDPRLTILLEIQDLKEHIRELEIQPEAASLQSEQFNIDVDDAIRSLETKVTDLAGVWIPSSGGATTGSRRPWTA